MAVESLASAIAIATSDAVMQQKAAQLSLKISSENGVEQAVAIIHQYLQNQIS